MNSERWYRVGVRMSLTALVVLILAVGFFFSTQSGNWHAVTRYSDVQEDVIRGIAALEEEIDGLEAEIDFRRQELAAAAERGRLRAEDARAGIVKSGETLDDARRERLLNEEAPQWDRVAETARAALERVRAR